MSSIDRLAVELSSPVALLGVSGWSVDRLRALLPRAELRAWRIVDSDAPGLWHGRCPLGSGQTLLAWPRPPVGRPEPGAFVVARSLPVGPERCVLLGRPFVVPPARAPMFDRLLRSLRAPRGEFWRVHGAVIARAARSGAATVVPRAA
ncbi:MAG TPA: hypothetical protein VFP55_04550 [Solirubrobacteraceae bacterium]|nr:hypothetical protein [Solirubrobacteraceae bacterium]